MNDRPDEQLPEPLVLADRAGVRPARKRRLDLATVRDLAATLERGAEPETADHGDGRSEAAPDGGDDGRDERRRTRAPRTGAADEQPAPSTGGKPGRPPKLNKSIPSWLLPLARRVAAGTSILDPKFAGLLAEAVFSRAGQMPERDVVAALNTCTTMAAKAKMMAGKGLTTDVDPLTEIRGWFSNRVTAPAKGPDERDPLPIEDELDALDNLDIVIEQKEDDDGTQEPDGPHAPPTERPEVQDEPAVHGTVPENS